MADTPAMSETTQETAPTPGPWKLSHSAEYAEIIGPPRDDLRRLIATIDRCDDEDDANAAHIVKCVNAYPDLVAGLAFALPLVREHFLRTGALNEEFAALEAAAAALSKAGA